MDKPENAGSNGRHQAPARPCPDSDRTPSVAHSLNRVYPVTDLVFDRLSAQSSRTPGRAVLMLPGWKESRNTMRPLGRLLSGRRDTILLGLPGFSAGESPMHAGDWGPLEYADCVFDFLQQQKISEVTLIGHSFGARVAIYLGSKHPEIVKSLVLLAAPGLKPVGRKKLKRDAKRRFNRLLKRPAVSRLLQLTGSLLPERFVQVCRGNYARHFISFDYRNAGVLRTTLVKAVNEDLSPLARCIPAPTLLLYGQDDAETPPEIGERYHRLFPQSSLMVLEGKDHFPHLTTGASLCAYYIEQFLDRHQAPQSSPSR